MARYLDVLSQAAGKNGQVLVGATLEFFEAETTTPLDTFQDEALTILNTNPVIADGEGRFPDIFLKNQKYFVEFKDAGGSEKDSHDNVTGPVIGSNSLENIAAMTALLKSTLLDGASFPIDSYETRGDNGGDRFFFRSTGAQSTATTNPGTIFATDEGGTGRWFREYKNTLTLADFNVKTDGTDQSVAVQAAVDFCAANGVILEGIDGSITLNATVNLKTNLIFEGTGKKSSKFVAASTIGQKNLFAATTQTNIIVSNFGFDMRNDIITPVLSDGFLEHILFFQDCKDIEVHRCDFDRALQRDITARGVTAAGDQENLFFHHNSHSNGSRGAVNIVRFGKNIHIHDNTMVNTVQSSVGGIAFEKPITVTGSVDVFIYKNNVLQTIAGDGGAIIIEFLSVKSENCHIYQNTYKGAKGGNAFKFADSTNIHIWGNKADDTNDAGFDIAGCDDVWCYNNEAINCGTNSYLITSDINLPVNIHLYKNKSKNPNVLNAALGVPVTDGSSTSSYHIAVPSGGDHIYIHDNVLEDDAATANGIFVNNDEVYIYNNDFTGIANKSPSSVIVVNTRFMNPATQTYRVYDNPGFPTCAEGVASITTGNDFILVSPTVVTGTPFGLARLNVTQRTALSDNQAYFFADPDVAEKFAIRLRTSAHAVATNTSTIDFWFNIDISRVIDDAAAGI